MLVDQFPCGGGNLFGATRYSEARGASITDPAVKNLTE